MFLVRVDFIAGVKATVVKQGRKVALKGGNCVVSFGSVVEGTNACVCMGGGGGGC
jgi:hypothetical protein